MQIIAIDDDPIMLHTIQMVLEETFGSIEKLEHPDKLANLVGDSRPKVIILDLNFSRGDEDGAEGLAWVKRIKKSHPFVSIIILTAHGFVDVAVKALKQGATDFLEKPFSNEKLIATVQAALNLTNSNLKLANVEESRNGLIEQVNRFDQLVAGKSAAMSKLMETVLKVANTEASVLITGEHGTGKEMMAQFIHQQSDRASQPFVLADLASISSGVFESTLFGHVKGAYTDAVDDKAGLIETANLGTLLLDEIGDLSFNLQSKLLAVLENREVMRVGEHRARAVDIRLLTTSHKSLGQLHDVSQFRQDLLFRINTVHLEIPPLRHRKDDIRPLLVHFLAQFNRKYNREFELTKSQTKELIEYSWPGNVRELRNSIERMVIMNDAKAVIKNAAPKEQKDNLYEIEKQKIEELIERNAGNITRAASELGIGRNTLYRKMKKYGLD